MSREFRCLCGLQDIPSFPHLAPALAPVLLKGQPEWLSIKYHPVSSSIKCHPFGERCSISTGVQRPHLRGAPQRDVGAPHPAVEALINGGAALIGAAHVDVLGISGAAPCQSVDRIGNPLCSGRVILGSNGALTALVAAGQASLGVGVDSGADVAVAASCAGLLAFRCSHGVCGGEDSELVLMPSLTCSALTLVSSSSSVLTKVRGVTTVPS